MSHIEIPKLTRILEDSLGGNCKTTMMAMISPALEAFLESISTLKFANRAKNIKNVAVVNEDLDEKALIRRYERELKKLRAQLAEKAKHVVDQRKVIELEEQKRRAERDKVCRERRIFIKIVVYFALHTLRSISHALKNTRCQRWDFFV